MPKNHDEKIAELSTVFEAVLREAAAGVENTTKEEVVAALLSVTADTCAAATGFDLTAGPGLTAFFENRFMTYCLVEQEKARNG